MLANPAVKAAHKAQEAEFALFDEIVRARKRANLTQSQIAERMGTRVSAISRLECARTRPSLSTLERYAKATGHKLQIKLIPEGPGRTRARH